MKLLGAFLFTAVTAFGQLAPPPAQTNIVRLTPETQLRWSPNAITENIHGYQVRAQQQQGPTLRTWNHYTAATNVLVSALAPNIIAGPATFTVSAFSTAGLESTPSTVSTNLAAIPSAVRGIEITTIIVINP